MSYTPINWQTGDQITAEKMNKMDNGWGIGSAQLFSETVTTTAASMGNKAPLTYALPITSSTLAVTFNGTSYVCPKIESLGQIFYGGFDGSTGMPDFTTIPFFIVSGIDAENLIYTETAGTYAIAVSAAAIETSSNFDSAVVLAGGFEVVSGTTTFQEASDAFKSGKYVYVVDNSSSGKTYRNPVILVNESAFEIKFISTMNSDTELVLAGLTASSADGVLE